MDEAARAERALADNVVPLRPARARLAEAPPDLGPISPELVLVSPDLAEAALGLLAAAPPPWRPADEPRPLRQAPPPRPAEPGPVPASPGPVRLDTADLRLRTHGISLEFEVHGAEATWRLGLPREELVECEQPADRDEPPAPIAALIRTLSRGRPLGPIPWHCDEPDFARLQDRVGDELAALLRHDPGTRLGLDPENLHQFRVAGRRLRAFLRLGRGLVDEEWSRSVRGALGELAAASGPVRDLDVLLEWLRAEVERLSPDDRAHGDGLIAALDAQREQLRTELLGALDGPSYARLLETLAAPVQAAPVAPSRSLRRRAGRGLQRLVVDVRRLGNAPTDEAVHALRLRVKRVRYAVELAGEQGGRRTQEVLRAAKLVQDVTGEHQDTVVAERLLAGAGTADARLAFVAGRLAERQRQRRDALREALPAAWKQLRRASRRLR